MNVLEEARKVFDTEIESLEKTRDALNEIFVEIIDTITQCDGKVIVTGMGKPGHIATKIAATFSSLGIPSFFLHPAEAMHGDLGMISQDDIILAISFSGESEEIVSIMPIVKTIGAKIVAITGNSDSSLAQTADIVQVLPNINEACHLGLAPTSSTTVELVYGDALAVVASEAFGFTDKDFGLIHPAGSLGKKLFLKVRDLMIREAENAVVCETSSLKDVIIEISKKELGMTSVVDIDGKFIGIITSGDVRRILEENANIDNKTASEVVKREPFVANPSDMAIDILQRMVEHDIMHMPVVDDGYAVGTIKMRDIIKSGLVIPS